MDNKIDHSIPEFFDPGKGSRTPNFLGSETLRITDDSLLLRVEGIVNRITSVTAGDLLEEIKAIPSKVSTFRARIAILRADSQMPSWKAFINGSTDALQKEYEGGSDSFWDTLVNPAAFTPEVQGVHHKIMQNMLIKLKSQPEEEVITIARGAPAAGKTTFLRGRFSVACDDVKASLLDFYPDLTPSQVHVESSLVLERFRRTVEEKLSRPLTVDALYVKPDALLSRLKMAVEKGLQVRFKDIHVDLTTLCCRVLKRQGSEPRIPFSAVSASFRASVENRIDALNLVEAHKDRLVEFRLDIWTGDGYQAVAELDPETKEWQISDGEALQNLVFPVIDTGAIIEEVRNIPITEELINQFPAEFRHSLEKYRGKTLEEALDVHAKEPVGVTLGGRLLADVVSSITC